MSRKAKIKKAEKDIRGFLEENPSRRAITIDEFSGGRAAIMSSREPRSPYAGDQHEKPVVAHVFQILQTEGLLGRPFRLPAIPRDYAMPRQFPVLSKKDSSEKSG